MYITKVKELHYDTAVYFIMLRLINNVVNCRCIDCLWYYRLGFIYKSKYLD